MVITYLALGMSPRSTEVLSMEMGNAHLTFVSNNHTVIRIHKKEYATIEIDTQRGRA